VESPVLDKKQFLFWNSKKKFIRQKNHPYKKLYYRNKLKEEGFRDVASQVLNLV